MQAIKGRSFDITEADNGGWVILTAYLQPGVPQHPLAAFTSTGDLLTGLAKMLSDTPESDEFTRPLETYHSSNTQIGE